MLDPASLAIVGLNGAALWLVRCVADPERDAERYYRDPDRCGHARHLLFFLAYSVLFISFALNARRLLSALLGQAARAVARGRRRA